MTRAARYTVLIDRELGESDGDAHGYHDGTGPAAVEQLSRELQRAWESGDVSGYFEVVSRQLIDWPEGRGGGDLIFAQEPTHFEDNSAGPNYAGRLRFLGALLADLKDEFGTGEVAISLDNALDNIDSAIRTLESDDEPESDDDPNLTYASDGDLVWVDDLHGEPASAPMIRQHLNEGHSVTTADLADYDLVEVHEHEHRVAGPIE